MNKHINIQTLPASWFPDLAAVKAFIEGPRYDALSSLALGAYDSELPEPLAAEARQAGLFIAGDLLELGRYAVVTSAETFEAQREEGSWSGEWPKWLGMLSAVALVGNYVERIYEPILEMQAEAETEQEARRMAEAEVELREMEARRADK